MFTNTNNAIVPMFQGTIAAQFNCEGTTLSGVDFELVGHGYRLSLVKKRFVSGKKWSRLLLLNNRLTYFTDKELQFILIKALLSLISVQN